MQKNDAERIEIAKRLRAAREQCGLSQGQVAEIMKLQRPSISEIEAGRRGVSAEELARFSKIYGVSTSWLTKSAPEIADPSVELAARELAKLNSKDLDMVLQLLKTLKRTNGPKV